MPIIQPIDLDKKTVFVLGAGASKPYGFPLGTELKGTMIANLSNAVFRVILRKYNFDESLINDFVEALPRTYHSTIDIFLEKKRKFREIGAYVIAYSLLPLENANLLFPQNDWYAHIFNVLNFENVKPDLYNITFVSLNYDRSLEHFLYKNIQYNCPDDSIKHAEMKLSNLKIIHAHGSLGLYPQTPYGANTQTELVLRQAALGIRIISDKMDDSDDFRNAQKAINDAYNLVFIGFGFDPSTLERLTKDANLSEKKIFGTTFGLDKNRMNFILSFFQENAKINNLIVTDTGTIARDFVTSFLPIIPGTN